MPRGGGVVAIGTIRRSLPSAKAALIMATAKRMRTPQGVRLLDRYQYFLISG
jgi:hypothetical protein